MAWLLAVVVAACSLPARADVFPDALRVQLSWHHQAQFAGFYVASQRGYFASHGLTVVTLPGAPDLDPLDALEDGRADVALAQAVTVLRRGEMRDPIVNVAQLFRGSPLLLMCRVSAGVGTLEDVVGKSVAVASWGDREIVRAMLATIAPDDSTTSYPLRGDRGDELLDGRTACVTGMNYNEYLRVVGGALPKSDLVVFHAEEHDVLDLQDGLYVRASRLQDATFVARLAALVDGLQQGWTHARQHPAAAVVTVLQVDPTLERLHQTQMLEAVLDLLPERDIGYLDPRDVDALSRSQASYVAGRRIDAHWTHSVWNEVLALQGRAALISDGTLHHARVVQGSAAFSLVLLFGVCFFALAGALEAVRLEYDLWGRLVIACVTALGGGMIRDLLLGGSRLPFGFVADPLFPLAILLVVASLSTLLVVRPGIGAAAWWADVRRVAEAVGFGVLTVYGAVVCLLAGAAWYWAPACAAMTCAGGGIVRDMIVNREPRNFRGALYEEVAVAGGLLLVGGLWLANHFEHERWLVTVVMATTGVLSGWALYLVNKHQIRHPRWLTGTRTDR